MTSTSPSAGPPRPTRREVLRAGALGIAAPFAARASAWAVLGHRSRADSLRRLDDDIRAQMRDGHIPGLAACVVRDGEVAWARGYGRMNLERDVRTTRGTVFMLASISKTFIATAVMQAVEAGLLDLDADVDDVLPFSVRIPRHPDVALTPRMLLTHTSAIRDRWSVWGRPGGPGALYSDGDSAIALETFLRRYLVPGGRYYVEDGNFYVEAPGMAYRYSNIGAALAAYLVEAASGQPFDRWCEERIFAPLGMTQTSWHLAGLDRRNVAMPYRWRPGPERFEAYGQYGYPDYPDGALRTSAPQLARHLLAFAGLGRWRGARILSEDSVREIRRSQLPHIVPGQGLIWYRVSQSGERLLGHNGGDYGVSTQMFLRPRDGAGVIVLQNADAYTPMIRIQTRLWDEVDRL
jgi:CubicO group peptidase (beta-lactamase class C family)